MVPTDGETADSEVRTASRLIKCRAILVALQFVIPLVAPVFEVGKKEVRGQAGVLAELVVRAHGSTPAQPLVTVLALRDLVVIRGRGSVRVDVGIGFDIVDATAVVIVTRIRLGVPGVVMRHAAPQEDLDNRLGFDGAGGWHDGAGGLRRRRGVRTERVLFSSMDLIMSEGIVARLIWRTFDSGDGTVTPSIVRLVRRGSSPRTWM